MFIKTLIKLKKNLFFFIDIKIWLKIIKKNNVWGNSSSDIYTVLKLIKIYKPKNILELGMGEGTLTENIMNEIGNKNNMLAIENNKKCIREFKKKNYNSIISASKSFKIIQSNLKICKKKTNIETLMYKISYTLNVSNYDLIIIDGPSFIYKKKLITDLPRGDFFYYFNKIKAGCIIVFDGSIITQKLINRFCLHDLINYNLFKKKVYIKKSAKANLVDSKLKKYKELKLIK